MSDVGKSLFLLCENFGNVASQGKTPCISFIRLAAGSLHNLLYLRLGPHPLIVTTRGNGTDIRSLYIPSIPLLVGGGPANLYLSHIFHCFSVIARGPGVLQHTLRFLNVSSLRPGIDHRCVALDLDNICGCP